MIVANEFRTFVSDAFVAGDVDTVLSACREAKAAGDKFLTGYAVAAWRCLTDAPDSPAVSQPVKPVAKVAALPLGFYTVTFADGEYVTLRVQEDFRDNPDANTRVIGFLSGPNNTSDYTGFAFVVSGQVRTWNRYKGKLARQHEALAVLMGAESTKEFGKAYAQISGNCYVCGRTLTTPESIAAGIGPVCAEKGM